MWPALTLIDVATFNCYGYPVAIQGAALTGKWAEVQNPGQLQFYVMIPPLANCNLLRVFILAQSISILESVPLE